MPPVILAPPRSRHQQPRLQIRALALVIGSSRRRHRGQHLQRLVGHRPLPLPRTPDAQHLHRRARQPDGIAAIPIQPHRPAQRPPPRPRLRHAPVTRPQPRQNRRLIHARRLPVLRRKRQRRLVLADRRIPQRRRERGLARCEVPRGVRPKIRLRSHAAYGRRYLSPHQRHPPMPILPPEATDLGGRT